MNDIVERFGHEPKPNNPIRGLAMINSYALVGVEACPVVVEVHLANGLPAFSTVGLPEASVRESKDRVRGAILNSGFEFPAKRITVNLSPADLPKSGSRFDLPIAIGILVASGQVSAPQISGFDFVGELALDGKLRGVSGILSTVLSSNNRSRELIVPHENQAEAALVEPNPCYSSEHLLDVCGFLAGSDELHRCQGNENIPCDYAYPDMADVKGQHHAKRAIEVAACGGHSILMYGPPGTGKSMLASRIPGLLPALSNQEALESAAIHSVAAGHFEYASWKRRPFRNPHHSASAVALVGGGSQPRPGEISLAHKGILFLDELTEFSRSALEQLREPLETGKVNIARASMSVEYPAEFQLVAACNPCKCGFLGDGTNRCHCSAVSIENYRSKLSGPMLDRIDMHIALQRVDVRVLRSDNIECENSSTIKDRVQKVREMQLQRQGQLNTNLGMAGLERHCALNSDLLSFFEHVCEKLNMSARAYHRVLKLSRTIADMSNQENISQAHLAEAITYRGLDRR